MMENYRSKRPCEIESLSKRKGLNNETARESKVFTKWEPYGNGTGEYLRRLFFSNIIKNK